MRERRERESGGGGGGGGIKEKILDSNLIEGERKERHTVN